MSRMKFLSLLCLTLCVYGCQSASYLNNPAPGKEVWVVAGDGDELGNGSVGRPYQCVGDDGLNRLFDMLKDRYGSNLTVHFGPGVFYGTKMIAPLSDWKIHGAGIDNTIFKTAPNRNSRKTIGFRAGSSRKAGMKGFEISDVTFDFNTPNMRRANRVFVYFKWNKKPYLEYFYAEDLPEWEEGAEYSSSSYNRKFPKAVMYKGGEYIATGKWLGKFKSVEPPAQGKEWSRLRPNDPAKLLVWKKGGYELGDAVSYQGKAYICVKNTNDEPAAEGNWRLVDSEHHDPLIHTQATFVGSMPPEGGNRISRCKAINGHGNHFFNREDFIFGLGGDNNVIEDCHVEKFLGDYSTYMVVFFGHNSVVRNCRAIGGKSMAYGGWSCRNAVFEGNYSYNVERVTNVDSLTCRNVIFRDNVFINCGRGIHFSLRGTCKAVKDLTMPPENVSIAKNEVNGMIITGNLIEIDRNPHAPKLWNAAIEVKHNQSVNVLIADNIIRNKLGSPYRAIWVREAKNVIIQNNVCDPDMSIETPKDCVVKNNLTFPGKTVEHIVFKGNK